MKDQLAVYFDRLWPINRSITGDGLRTTLKILSELMPLQIHEVPSGTKVFDWEVPEEWNIRDAYILGPDGNKYADFSSNNLHITGYSIPVDTQLTFEELAPHLHYLERLPEAIPYTTSYYNRRWGFAISKMEFLRMPRNGMYHVVIDSEIKKGSLTYGECLLRGNSEKEILLSSYVCHPSMANNELSGPLVLAFLYKRIQALTERKYTYRFVLAPETIGALCFLADRGTHLKENMLAGYVLSCCGDRAPLSYKFSRRGDTTADKAAMHVLRHREKNFKTWAFDPTGSDERQYCSPGFNLPLGVIARSAYSDYPEYHTSLDNRDFISFDHMADTVDQVFEIVKTIELFEPLRGTIQMGEPQLGSRGLYTDLSGLPGPPEFLLRRKRILNFADGSTPLIDLAERYGYYLPDLQEEIQLLRRAGLIGE
jgi:aminopeptidase-like protein